MGFVCLLNILCGLSLSLPNSQILMLIDAVRDINNPYVWDFSLNAQSNAEELQVHGIDTEEDFC